MLEVRIFWLQSREVQNGDIYDGRCDLCNEFVGSDLVIGENSIVQTNTYTYKRFIPDESCNYWFYSVDAADSIFSILNNDFEEILSLDYSYDFDLTLNVELTEGEIYYLEIIRVNENSGYVLNLEKHNHFGENQDCCGGDVMPSILGVILLFGLFVLSKFLLRKKFN